MTDTEARKPQATLRWPLGSAWSVHAARRLVLHPFPAARPLHNTRDAHTLTSNQRAKNRAPDL